MPNSGQIGLREWRITGPIVHPPSSAIIADDGGYLFLVDFVTSTGYVAAALYSSDGSVHTYDESDIAGAIGLKNVGLSYGVTGFFWMRDSGSVLALWSAAVKKWVFLPLDRPAAVAPTERESIEASKRMFSIFATRFLASGSDASERQASGMFVMRDGSDAEMVVTRNGIARRTIGAFLQWFMESGELGLDFIHLDKILDKNP